MSSGDVFSRTELNRNGDPDLSVSVNGQSQYPKIDYTAEGSMHGELFNQIFQGSRSEYWSVTINPFIPYYSSYIQTIYNLKIRL